MSLIQYGKFNLSIVEMLRGASDEVRSSRVSKGEGVGTYLVIILFAAVI